MVKIEREQRSKMKNQGRQEKAKMGSQKGVGVKNKKFKKGIASFYIVTFTTLILTIMTASFAVVMVSEVTRTANDELSQSAYDAALAGIEDAKIAYANYQRCETAIRTGTVIDTTESESCNAIIDAVKNAENTTNCDLVGQLTGRLKDGATGEVVLNESGDNNGMNQAYTCVTIKTSLSDYRSTLSSRQQVRVIRGIFDDAEASAIKSIRLSWATNKAGAPSNFSLHNNNSGKIVFYSSNNGQNVAQPPMLEVQILQTAPNFTVNQILQETTGGATDRATLYLVPTDDNSGANSLDTGQVAKTNDRTIKNEPFAINCNTSTEEEFACSVDIALPEPINAGTGDSVRNGDTFAIMIALPYGQPDTDVSVQFCNREKCEVTSDGTSISDSSVVMLKNLQVEIDSTGRANDLYRRVKTRLEPADTAFSYPYYALQLLGDGGSELLAKKMTVLCENQLYDLGRDNGNGNNGQGVKGGKITRSSRNSSDGCGKGAESFTRQAPNPIEDNSSNIEWVEPTIVEPGRKEDGSEYVPQYYKPSFWPSY